MDYRNLLVFIQRLNSYGNSRPFLTQDHDCHLQLPCDQTSFENNNAVNTEHLKGKNPRFPNQGNEHMGAFAYLVRIVSLWGDVLKYFHLSGFATHDAEQIPTKFEPDPEFEKFVDRLQEWKNTLPSKLRYSEDNLRSQISDGTVGTFVMMHVMFHTCSVYVYRYVTTITIPKSSGQHVPKDYILKNIGEIFIHTDSVMIIMEQVWRQKKEAEKSGGEPVIVVAPFIGQAVLNAGLISIIRACHSREGAAFAAQSKRIKVALKWLKELRKYWKPIGSMYNKLRMGCNQASSRNSAAKLLPESSSGTGSASVSPKQIAPFENSFIPSPASQQIHQLHTSVSHNALEFAYDPGFTGVVLQYSHELIYDVYFNDAFSGQSALNQLAEYGMNPEYPGLYQELLPTTGLGAHSLGQIESDIGQQPHISTLNSTIISQSPSMTNTSTSSTRAQNPYLDHNISENNMVTSPEHPSTVLPSDVPGASPPPHSAATSDCDDSDDEHDEHDESEEENFVHQYVETRTTKDRMEIFHCLNEDVKEGVRKVVEASEKNILDDDEGGQSGCTGEMKYSKQTPDGESFATGAEGVEIGG